MTEFTRRASKFIVITTCRKRWGRERERSSERSGEGKERGDNGSEMKERWVGSVK